MTVHGLSGCLSSTLMSWPSSLIFAVSSSANFDLLPSPGVKLRIFATRVDAGLAYSDADLVAPSAIILGNQFIE